MSYSNSSRHLNGQRPANPLKIRIHSGTEPSHHGQIAELNKISQDIAGTMDGKHTKLDIHSPAFQPTPTYHGNHGIPTIKKQVRSRLNSNLQTTNNLPPIDESSESSENNLVVTPSSESSSSNVSWKSMGKESSFSPVTQLQSPSNSNGSPIPNISNIPSTSPIYVTSPVNLGGGVYASLPPLPVASPVSLIPVMVVQPTLNTNMPPLNSLNSLNPLPTTNNRPYQLQTPPYQYQNQNQNQYQYQYQYQHPQPQAPPSVPIQSSVSNMLQSTQTSVRLLNTPQSQVQQQQLRVPHFEFPQCNTTMTIISSQNTMIPSAQTQAQIPTQTATTVPNAVLNPNNNNSSTRPNITSQTEQKYNMYNESRINNQNYLSHQMAPTPRQWLPSPPNRSSPNKFNPKFNNHAKGNFFISKEMINHMIKAADEPFKTNDIDDEKLAFGYYKESIAMSINDGQIDEIFQIKDGQKTKEMIIINIDLHFKPKSLSNGKELDVMYLIAMENDAEYRERVQWCIVDFMSAEQISVKYGINKNRLPKSSRNMEWFRDGIKRAPINLSRDEIVYIVRNTYFKGLPNKTSKRVKDGNNKIIKKDENKIAISEQDLKLCVRRALEKDFHSKPMVVPVVVIKGNKQWIEWKRFIEITGNNHNRYNNNKSLFFVGISMRYDDNNQWKIECMDYDAGRVFYQYRLTALSTRKDNNEYNYTYNEISKRITVQLDIFHNRKSQRRHNYNYNYNYNHNNNPGRRQSKLNHYNNNNSNHNCTY